MGHDAAVGRGGATATRPRRRRRTRITDARSVCKTKRVRHNGSLGDGGGVRPGNAEVDGGQNVRWCDQWTAAAGGRSRVGHGDRSRSPDTAPRRRYRTRDGHMSAGVGYRRRQLAFGSRCPPLRVRGKPPGAGLQVSIGGRSGPGDPTTRLRAVGRLAGLMFVIDHGGIGTARLRSSRLVRADPASTRATPRQQCVLQPELLSVACGMLSPCLPVMQ